MRSSNLFPPEFDSLDYVVLAPPIELFTFGSEKEDNKYALCFIR